MFKILTFDPQTNEPSPADWVAFDEAPLFNTEAEAEAWLDKWQGNPTTKIIETA